MINKVKSVFALDNRPVRKNKKPRDGDFYGDFAMIGTRVKKQKKNLQINQRSSLQGQLLQISPQTTLRAKRAQCGAVALSALIISLPVKCVVEEGRFFITFSGVGSNILQ